MYAIRLRKTPEAAAADAGRRFAICDSWIELQTVKEKHFLLATKMFGHIPK